MVTQKLSTLDTIQSHPLAKELEVDAQFALLCEYVDLQEALEGMSLVEYIDGWFATLEGAIETAETTTDEVAAEPEESAEVTPSDNGDGDVERPDSMVKMRVVYRLPDRGVLSDANGVTRDAGGVVSFIDVEGAPWSNVRRDSVYPIDPKNYRVVHIIPREAKEIRGWLDGTPAKGQPDGALLRSIFVEFKEHSDRIAFAIMNHKRPYVDKFVALPDSGFEDDQKPTTYFFGEHCFRVRGVDWIVKVVTP